MSDSTTAHRCERKTDHSPLGGAILIVLGVIALSYLELELVARVPESTVADDFALASDLLPVLDEDAQHMAMRRSDARDQQGVIPATSLVESALMGSRRANNLPRDSLCAIPLIDEAP